MVIRRLLKATLFSAAAIGIMSFASPAAASNTPCNGGCCKAGLFGCNLPCLCDTCT